MKESKTNQSENIIMWKSIHDELPESGLFVLVFVQNVYGGKTRRLRAQYAAKHSLLANMHYCDELWCEEDKNGDYYCPAGWYETNEFDECSYKIEGDVTHWMKLPDEPTI